MDEVRHIYMMDNYKAGRPGKDGDLSQGDPLHVTAWSARYVVGVGDELRFDPETAHARAGDPGYEVRLPESCGLCKAQELAQEATPSDEEEA